MWQDVLPKELWEKEPRGRLAQLLARFVHVHQIVDLNMPNWTIVCSTNYVSNTGRFQILPQKHKLSSFEIPVTIFFVEKKCHWPCSAILYIVMYSNLNHTGIFCLCEILYTTFFTFIRGDFYSKINLNKSIVHYKKMIVICLVLLKTLHYCQINKWKLCNKEYFYKVT